MRPPLEEQARQVLHRVRRAFAAIIDLTCGATKRSTQIADRLRVHRKLAWQISKVAHTPDAFHAARFIPAPGNMETFLAAARRRGVTEELLQAAAAAVADFENLVPAHADDRRSLELMLLGCSSKPDDDAEAALRRSAFLSNALTWGVQAKTRLVANLLAPTGDGSRFDLVRIRGYTDFRRNRPNQPWIVSYTRSATDNWGALPESPEPIDDTGGLPVPLLCQFCSDPLPAFRRRPGTEGCVVDELAPGRVGNTGAVTFFTGEISRNSATRYRDAENTFNEFSARIQTPTEVLVFDVYVCDSMFGPIEPKSALYSALVSPSSRDEGDRLPIVTQVTHLGRGLDVIFTPDVPRYVDLTQYVFDRLGWDEARFDVYRVRMEYPPMPTVLTIAHPLPDQPR
jgi:hypothetical protein